MRAQGKLLSEPQKSVGKYIRSIGRQYFNTLIVMMFLIGATYLTVVLALERHSLQQDISWHRKLNAAKTIFWSTALVQAA